ncbi:hypothetical protein A0H81_11223 [Grifola frondosa]|uniref:Uncharacterized protein n=1 Tax=Grifola frondosa TaxID=5627 RepID=A0A1C7LVS6_GRIFR|nr:hypothetical protein A0H81_11223 [Grifola frondosa]
MPLYDVKFEQKSRKYGIEYLDPKSGRCLYVLIKIYSFGKRSRFFEPQHCAEECPIALSGRNALNFPRISSRHYSFA